MDGKCSCGKGLWHYEPKVIEDFIERVAVAWRSSPDGQEYTRLVKEHHEQLRKDLKSCEDALEA